MESVRNCPILARWVLVSALFTMPMARYVSAPSLPLAPPGDDDLCPPLEPPTGNIVEVATVGELQNAVNSAVSGDTILIAEGTYQLDGVYLRIDVPNVTLRSASGNREGVVLDGNYVTTEIIQIIASDVTVADMTLREAYNHPIHVMSTDSGHTLNTLIYNVHIIDPGEQAIKINPHTGQNAQYFTDNGTIACSHIELTDAGRPHIRNNCYTGGVDAHQSRGWVIRDNLIEGFWCEYGLSEHGIHLWRACRDTLVERNEVRDNARGIGFGLVTSGEGVRTYADNPCPGAVGYVDDYGGIIRNNFVFASDSDLFDSQSGFDCGICLANSCGTYALHNTVASTQAPFSSIEWRFDNTDADVVNNLVSHNLRDREGTARLSGNLEHQPLSLFVDGSNGDLHLSESASAAIDQGVAVTAGLCDDDFDGDARPIGDAPDVGADEFGVAPPPAVTDLRISKMVTNATTLTATLTWTPSEDAVTTTLRYNSARITEENWEATTLLTDALNGSASMFTAVISQSDPVYFAHRWQNAVGAWSGLSNNAFWPSFPLYLPLVLRR